MDHNYEAVRTQENLNKIEPFDWKSFLRQTHISSGVWTMYYLAGICAGAPTVIIPQLRREAKFKEVVDDELASWFYSLPTFASIPWLIIIPVLSRYTGRKPVYLVSCVSSLTVFVIMYCSKTPHVLLYSGAVQGFTNASNVTMMCLIVIEYTSPKYRGIFMNLATANFFWGIWTSNAIGTFFYWKYIPLLGIICSVYMFSVITYPESPYWLVSQGRFRETEIAFRWLRGRTEESEKELRDLINSQMDYQTNKRNKWSVSELKSKQFCIPLLITILIGAETNFSGKLVCSAYAIDVMIKITNNESTAYAGMLILDGATVIGMYLGAYVLNVVKRRVALFTSSFICTAFLLMISLYLYLVNLSVIAENNVLCLTLLVCYSLSICCGQLSITFAIYGEIISVKYQTISFTITSLVYMLFCAIMLKFATVSFNTLTMHGTFLFFGVMYGLCTLILYIYLPETKGKTLLEIEDYFKDKTKRDANSELLCSN